MTCIICDSQCSWYFSKMFATYNLRNVDYWKCESCGFVFSKTHFGMPVEQWVDLNSSFHVNLPKGSDNPWKRLDRIKEQARVISILDDSGIIQCESALDYGCGDAKLSVFLRENHGLRLMNYDKYLYEPDLPKAELDFVSEEFLLERTFDLVTCTGVFEHIRSLAELEMIEALVSDGGCFSIHTLVRETIPRDPDWFYLLPVHSAFHTNKSMQVFMERFNYKFSVYHVTAKMWFLFRDIVQIEKLNHLARLGEPFHWKVGFVDYWKI